MRNVTFSRHAGQGATFPQTGDGERGAASLESFTLLSHGVSQRSQARFTKPGEEHHTEQGTNRISPNDVLF